MPLDDGRWGLCRVLRENTPELLPQHGEYCVLVAASPWIGSAAPDLADPQLRHILILNHHRWNNQPEMCWVSVPPPDDFQPIGVIEPTADESQWECPVSGGWSFAHQLLLQWRWDHEREAVLREDAQQAQHQAAMRKAAERHRQHARGKLTLATLRKKTRFADWKGVVPNEAIRACQKAFRDAIDALQSLEAPRTESAAIPILQKCIEQLNELDAAHGHFIETIFREKLCDEFDDLAYAAGLRHDKHKNLADRWREW